VRLFAIAVWLEVVGMFLLAFGVSLTQVSAWFAFMSAAGALLSGVAVVVARRSGFEEGLTRCQAREPKSPGQGFDSPQLREPGPARGRGPGPGRDAMRWRPPW